MPKLDKAYVKAITSDALTQLLSDVRTNLEYTSTDRQAGNGTIALAGNIKGKPVEYKITATGAVLSNRYVARQVFADTPGAMYKAGLKAVGELIEKRLSVGIQPLA